VTAPVQAVDWYCRRQAIHQAARPRTLPASLRVHCPPGIANLHFRIRQRMPGGQSGGVVIFNERQHATGCRCLRDTRRSFLSLPARRSSPLAALQRPD
jgi:hypothetical protein